MSMYQRAPADLTESTFRGKIMSMVAAISISTLFLLETKAYFSTTLETDLLLHNPTNDIDEPQVQLNFDITMMDMPCEQATVDVFSTVGFEKNVTKNIRKYPIDEDGVRQQYEARNWHQDDVELWDPAVSERIEDLHKDGEDAISLDVESFPYALKQFPYLFVKFYSDDCTNCNDLAPTWEALGEVITDTAMNIVDEHMESQGMASNQYADDEYESAVNAYAPVLVTKLNCSLYPSICNTQGIRVYPTMRLFVDGEAKGDYNGHRTVLEIVHWLSHIEAEYREPRELRMRKVLQFANERTVRNRDERDWNDALTSYRSPWGSWNVTRHPGCQLTGHIMVDKAPGKFVVHSESYGHDMAAHMTNLSHIVHHFSFGDSNAQDSIEALSSLPKGTVKSLHPLDENVYVTGELHQAYHHHLRVIATDFRGKLFNLAREKVLRVYRILHNSQLSTYREHIVPKAEFSYDLSPLSVAYHEESTHWYDYLTSIMAIVGGAFTVVGLMERSVSGLSTKKSTPAYYY